MMFAAGGLLSGTADLRAAPLHDARARAAACGARSVDQADRALRVAEQGLADTQDAGSVEARILFHYCRAGALEFLRGERAGLPDYSEGIALAARHGLAELQGRGLHSRATTVSLLGEQARALIDLLEAQTVYRRARLEDQAERHLAAIAAAYRRMGELDTALRYLEQSRTYATGRADAWLLHQTLLQLGYVHYDREDYAASLQALEAAMRLHDVASSPYYRGVVRVAIAAAQIGQGRHVQALAALDLAAADFAQVDGDASAQIMLDLRRGEALAGMGRHEVALRRYNDVLLRLDGREHLRYLSIAHELRAASHRALGNAEAAVRDYMRYNEARTELDRMTRQQQDLLLRHRFDASRREIENRRLTRETELRREQVQSVQATRRWQGVALATSSALALLLAALGIRQLLLGRRLQHLAMTDALTGAGNRRSFEKGAAIASAHAHRHDRPLSVLAVDIDHFKRVNDTHGHGVGDEVLRGVTRACQQVLREQDRFARIGGEEFVALLPDTDAGAAAMVAERLRRAVEQMTFGEPGAEWAVTVSVGQVVAHRGEAIAALLERADAALYRAKAEGRNRVVSA